MAQPVLVAALLVLAVWLTPAERVKSNIILGIGSKGQDRPTTRLPLLPYPAEVKLGHAGIESFVFRKDTPLSVGPGIPDDHLSVKHLRELQAKVGKAGQGAAISMKLIKEASTDSSEAEGYQLRVAPTGLELESPSLAGLFHGVQTIRQLAASAQLPAVEIKDAPRFGWRGLHLDVSRHFFNATEVKRLLDVMALYKLNRFHWHLTDDQGWRLPVDGYPNLLEVGAGGKAYTKEEVKDVVAYALARHIDIVPEVDVPGHVEAALAAYPELGNQDVKGRVGPTQPRQKWGVSDFTLAPKEQTWTFLSKVYDSVVELFPSQVVHIGGDEVKKKEWGSSDAAAQMLLQTGNIRGNKTIWALKQEAENKVAKLFDRKITGMLRSRGRRIAAWDEAQHEEGFPQDGIVVAWRSANEANVAVAAGRHVVIADQEKLYFDHAQADSDDSDEPDSFGGCSSLKQVYEYEPMPQGLSKDEEKLVLGAQGQLWAEYFPTWDHVEYMAFPRSLALAEKLWTPASSIQDLPEFQGRLVQRLADLERLGVNYRSLEKGGHCKPPKQ